MACLFMFSTPDGVPLAPCQTGGCVTGPVEPSCDGLLLQDQLPHVVGSNVTSQKDGSLTPGTTAHSCLVVEASVMHCMLCVLQLVLQQVQAMQSHSLWPSVWGLTLRSASCMVVDPADVFCALQSEGP